MAAIFNRITNTVAGVGEDNTKAVFKAENLPAKWSPYIGPILRSTGIALEKLSFLGEFFHSAGKDLAIILPYFIPVELFIAVNNLKNSCISRIYQERVLDANGEETPELKTTLRKLSLKVSDVVISIADSLKLPCIVSSLGLETALPVFFSLSLTGLQLIGIVGSGALMFSFAERSIQSYSKIKASEEAPQNIQNFNAELEELKTTLRTTIQTPEELQNLEQDQKILEANIKKQQSLIAEKRENWTKLAGQVSLVALGAILALGNITGYFLSFGILLTASIPIVTTFATQYFKEGRDPTTA